MADPLYTHRGPEREVPSEKERALKLCVELEGWIKEANPNFDFTPLSGLKPYYRAAVLCKLHEGIPYSELNKIPEDKWVRFRNCGPEFIKELERRGWIGDRIKSRAYSKRTPEFLAARRIEFLTSRIKRLERELKATKAELASINPP